MLIRVFRARPKPGMADELAQLIEEVSIPFVDGQPGLLARHTGRGFGATGDEIVMISVWESLDAMKNMTGENWESEVIPDEREAERIEECSVHHYESLDWSRGRSAMNWRDRGGIEGATIAALVPLEGKRLIDVGCGTGRLTSFAASRAAFVYAFDPNGEKVSQARAALTGESRRRVRFAVHGAEALDLPRARFDLALCGWSLWCVPLEGVVHALRRIHAALVPSGVLIDTQPVSARPPVISNGVRLGTLDMREWVDTVEAVDRLVVETIDAGLYALEHEQHFLVTDTYDNGPELVETVRDWQGTRISRGLEARVAAARPPLTLEQEVRLRLLRRRA